MLCLYDQTSESRGLHQLTIASRKERLSITYLHSGYDFQLRKALLTFAGRRGIVDI